MYQMRPSSPKCLIALKRVGPFIGVMKTGNDAKKGEERENQGRYA